ncbi:MAG: DNA gyrase inhibitor YacG [Acidobacteria bacterium]|nr:MAG: DNA gyrase inhibitor YacG [Acidobacteriota bacterium]
MPAPGDVVLCVFCRRHPVEPEWRPFCSERCKIQDLARWADSAYRVPGERLPQPDDSETEK